MPMSVTKTSGGSAYASPFLGPVNETLHTKIDVSGLTTDEVDAKGYLKPGVPLKIVGGLAVLLDGTSGEKVTRVTVEATKIVAENPTNTTLDAETGDPLIACAAAGTVQRDIGEDNLGRAYTANEIAGFTGSRFTLTDT